MTLTLPAQVAVPSTSPTPHWGGGARAFLPSLAVLEVTNSSGQGLVLLSSLWGGTGPP